jgi:hypothetical protein
MEKLRGPVALKVTGGGVEGLRDYRPRHKEGGKPN